MQIHRRTDCQSVLQSLGPGYISILRSPDRPFYPCPVYDTVPAGRHSSRKSYFLAGTLVVWDEDPVAKCVRKYRSDSPDQPVVFARGQVADAEPALPGWRMPVDRIFA